MITSVDKPLQWSIDSRGPAPPANFAKKNITENIFSVSYQALLRKTTPCSEKRYGTIRACTGFNQLRYLIGHFTFSVAGGKVSSTWNNVLYLFGRKNTQHQLKTFLERLFLGPYNLNLAHIFSHSPSEMF